MALIVIVDDEMLVIQLARMALEDAGHAVHTAQSGKEADRIADAVPRIDILIVDHWIPPETGRAIAERLVRRHRDAKVMHISGYSRDHLEAEDSFFPGAAFLGKPFGLRQIQESVAALLVSESRVFRSPFLN